MALHQTLKNLCFKSGWCYAVFWKLKRRSRMVLTWEDAFYECQLSVVDGKIETGRNPLVQGGARHDMERQIGLAVAQMSYCAYFMGEGIIGRVAFTGKHQWVFCDGDASTLKSGAGNSMNSQCMLEKHPSGWEVQFAAGIKTIAVIAVSHGVVQLGSTQMMMENLEWVDHVKSSFGTLQNVAGASISNLASEGQGGKATFSPAGMPCGNVSSTRLSMPNPNQFSWGAGDSLNTGLQSLVYGYNGMSDTVSHSSLQTLSTVVEPVDQPFLQKAEKQHTLDLDVRSTSLCLPMVNSSLQTFGSLPAAAPDVDSESSLTQQFPLQCEDMRSYHYGDLRTAQLRNIPVQCAAVNAFGRGLGPEPDADVSTSLYEQLHYNVIPAFSRALDPRSHISSASTSKTNLQQPKGVCLVPLAPFGDNSSANVKVSSLNGMDGTMGGAAISKLDSTSSYGGKNHGDLEFLMDSGIEGMPQIEAPHKECLKFYRKDPVSLPHGDIFENLVSGGWDNFGTFLASATQEKNSKWDCSFGIGDELSQALGPTFRSGNGKWEKTSKPSNMEQKSVVIEQHTSEATGAWSDISATKLVPMWGSSFVKNEPYFQESKSEPLLDAVVASASSSHPSLSAAADDSFSCRTFSAKDSEMSVSKSTKVAPLNHLRGDSSQDSMALSFVHAGPVDGEGSVNNQALGKVSRDPHTFNMSSSCSPLKAILSSWSEDMQSMLSNSTQISQSKKPEDLTKTTRKRARPGESTRPRPKDRQQIQDRVRELREIVPNGSKCSIDALLEKTIKHMLFLQNVTLHADSLRKNGELKDDVESGASWALELGGEDTGRPPILVKNLSQPRQLLVEMFCEEKSHFLEIADIIRSLGLTILKGVMEARSDKIWARFVVEANRDIHRVDIMMSLMHLLHVNNNSSSSLTMTSQTAPARSQPGVDSGNSSQTQT